jgi:peroxiredoxin
MTVGPTEPAPASAPEVVPPRKPRKIFLLLGVVVAIGLGIGLFTSVGTNKSSSPPHAGGALPSFSGTDLNGTGQVTVPADGVGNGTAGVVLFFGNWCSVCHTELPPLASAVRQQDHAGGALSKLEVIGVDSEDTTANAKHFIQTSKVSFPVAYDPNLTITSGAFYFEGDPHAVFVNANGTINSIVSGPMSAATFIAHEKRLIPSGK